MCWWLFCCIKDMRNTYSSLSTPLCMHNQTGTAGTADDVADGCTNSHIVIHKQVLVFVNFKHTWVCQLGEALKKELITINWEGNKLTFGLLSERIVYKGGPSGLSPCYHQNHLVLQNKPGKQPKCCRLYIYSKNIKWGKWVILKDELVILSAVHEQHFLIHFIFLMTFLLWLVNKI